MAKMELKPCRCGHKELHILRYQVYKNLHYCRIGCLNWDCCFSVGRMGLTAKQAERRAGRAWNRRVGNG